MRLEFKKGKQEREITDAVSQHTRISLFVRSNAVIAEWGLLGVSTGP